ncbi:MAG: hypothetical protein ACO3H6_03135 [Bacilli bacterium]
MKTLKLIFNSLFSNAPVMEARNQPWYIALALFIASILLATYPTFNAINDREGSAFLSGNTYSIENGLVAFTEALDTEDVDLVVIKDSSGEEESFQLVNQGSAWNSAFTTTLEDEPNFPFFAFNVNNQLRLRVFYQGDQTNEASNEFINRLLVLEAGDDAIGTFLFLGTETVYMYVYNPNGLSEGTVNGEGFLTAFSGTYHEIEPGTNLVNFARVDINGNAINNANVTTYVDEVFANWLNFFDLSFAYTKSVLILAQSGLTLVVNALMAFLMSVVIFIMTRGKTNPNRHFKFGETMKIGAWSLFSPALLTIVAGALFPEFAGTAFVLFVGLRLMWLSSRYLRPVDVVQTPVKK